MSGPIRLPRGISKAEFDAAADAELLFHIGKRCGSSFDGECFDSDCPQKVIYRKGCPLYPWDFPEECR